MMRDILNRARFATLDRSVATEAARNFVIELTDRTLGQEALHHPRKRARRRTDLDNFKLAIGALAADLIKHSANEDSDGYMFRPADRDELAQTLVSSDAHTKLRIYWNELGLMEETGFVHSRASLQADDQTKTYRKTRRFRATPRLLELAQNYQLTAANISEHFERSHKHANVLQVRGSKGSNYALPQRGKLIKQSGIKFQQRRAEVESLNRQLARHRFNLSVKPMLRRIFNCGDRKGFDFNLGGRFYCATEDDWMQMPKENRRAILIDGEPTCEIDVSSSQLSILYAIKGETLAYDPDPYQIDWIPREVTKQIIVASIGRGKPPSRWPRSFNEDFIAKHGYHPRDRYKLKDVVSSILARHPILFNLEPEKLDWAVLQYEEAECFLTAMQKLYDLYEIPSLPVHDSLIVRQRDHELALTVLKDAYRERLGFIPRVKTTMDSGFVLAA
ncbi:hypothetical protein [Ruegeria sp. Ofav3-42]|uniref:hypothetical protein n=1 Tax=Ruegeria sp. Ofav3-42 TaxID=2917759 RepID=UPI001EF42C07|nr:hypothetical protein [Ruegeria sp. Ofav3-42]MCG7520555.1 hypothetical protein [Ruegeria sp. Ofav3-42]